MDLLSIPVREVHGIGPQKAEDLSALGVTSAGGLLEYYPFRYEDYHLRDLTQVKDGEKITIQGTIYGEPVLRMSGRTKSRMSCKVVVDHFFVTAIFFNRHFLKDKLVPGEDIVLTGKWESHRQQITVSESEFPGKGIARTGTLQPVYSVGGGITQSWMRRTVRQAIRQYGTMIEENLPRALAAKYDFMSRRQAVAVIHEPESMEEGNKARRRMVYEELFFFQLKLQAFRALTRRKADGVAHPVDRPAVREFVRGLPFRLTNSQLQVIAELLEDLSSPHSMNRLLQGDVGSGKTVVAAVALYAVVKSGCQGALMVPTEILAEQHKRSLDILFAPYGIQLALLTGSLTGRQRKDVIASLQLGMADIVIGTHALIQEDVFFRRLGLVVTDEQHRFGVNQRAVLRRKGMNPDVLTMTATPIPRTLAITAFGDLDVSTLTELPKGRLPIMTYSVGHHMLERIMGFIVKEIETGGQAYIICPLIEESEKLDVQNAIDLHAQISHKYQNIGIGLLHGRMASTEKDEAMRAFAANETQILVSTTVIEVGVDVPGATIMVVYDADRFGLSQLHQLRGRVGRGVKQSYCILIADPKSEIGKERLRAMTETNDGFEIARRDLALRGPGDFFGTKQSGLPDFRIADLIADFATLEEARDDSAALTALPEFWTSLEYASLRQYLKREGILDGDILD
ncbi:MAG: ATP-dependent DNA helicase RecG [Gorillibacterium sp.]|nr:ATP-dependent DNA helicase RecG [Gorillibacterium sp.]